MGSIDNVLRRGGAVLVVSAAAMLLHGTPAMAQTLDFGSCVRIEDVLARLSCYDRAAGRTGPSQVPAQPAPAARAPAPAPAPAPAAAPAPSPAPAAPAAATVPSTPADPVARFGAESRPSSTQRAEDNEPREITAKVTAVRQRPAGEFVLTLDNGQVWQQTETRREPQFSVGDAVVIRKGMLGSYLLTLERGSASTRVRRIS